MSIDIPGEKVYAWEIEGTLPTDHHVQGRTWRRPVWFIASANSLEAALDKVRSKHPEIIFVKGYRTRHVEGMIV